MTQSISHYSTLRSSGFFGETKGVAPKLQSWRSQISQFVFLVDRAQSHKKFIFQPHSNTQDKSNWRYLTHHPNLNLDKMNYFYSIFTLRRFQPPPPNQKKKLSTVCRFRFLQTEMFVSFPWYPWHLMDSARRITWHRIQCRIIGKRCLNSMGVLAGRIMGGPITIRYPYRNSIITSTRWYRCVFLFV